MKGKKALDIILTLFEILILAAILVALIYSIYLSVGVYLEDHANAGDESYHAGFGFELFLLSIVLLFVNGGAFVLSLSGYLVSRFVKYFREEKKHRTRYLVLMLLPFLCQILYSFVFPAVLTLSVK